MGFLAHRSDKWAQAFYVDLRMVVRDSLPIQLESSSIVGRTAVTCLGYHRWPKSTEPDTIWQFLAQLSSNWAGWIPNRPSTFSGLELSSTRPSKLRLDPQSHHDCHWPEPLTKIINRVGVTIWVVMLIKEENSSISCPPNLVSTVEENKSCTKTAY